jgi:hypothetical protein
MVKITPEVLSKAFELLDNSLGGQSGEAVILEKAEDADDTNKVDENTKQDDQAGDAAKPAEVNDKDQDEDDKEVAKADTCYKMAKGLVSEGMNKEEVVKAMTSVGVDATLAETAADSCIAEASNLKENGGQVTVEGGMIQKSEEYTALLNVIDPMPQLIKGLEDGLGKKFSALGTILKSFLDEREDLRGTLEELREDVTKANEEIKLIGDAPIAPKSVRSVRAIERFEKSEDGALGENYNINSRSDMTRLGERLFAEVQIIKSRGNEDDQLEKAVMDLEISKATNFTALSPRLKAMGITLVQG